MKMLIALLAIAVLLASCDEIPIVTRATTPDHASWKHLSNADGYTRIKAYKIASAKTGIKIRFGYPSCPSAGDVCYWMGMTGIYISRAQSDRDHDLTLAMFDAEYELEH